LRENDEALVTFSGWKGLPWCEIMEKQAVFASLLYVSLRSLWLQKVSLFQCSLGRLSMGFNVPALRISAYVKLRGFGALCVSLSGAMDFAPGKGDSGGRFSGFHAGAGSL
jgi:hypothetical protein